MLALQHMTMPVARFLFENLRLANVTPKIKNLLITSFVLIQVVGILVFYFCMISYFSVVTVYYGLWMNGDHITDKTKINEPWRYALERLDNSASSLFDVYRYEYRYWLFFELFYEFLTSIFVMMAENSGKGW
jgi:hypothetical protein